MEKRLRHERFPIQVRGKSRDAAAVREENRLGKPCRAGGVDDDGSLGALLYGVVMAVESGGFNAVVVFVLEHLE